MSSDLNLPNILVWLKAFADAHYITLSINPQTEPLIADLSTVTATLSLRLMLTDEVKALATAVLTQKNAITITEGKALFLESVRKPCVVIPADTALAPLRLIDSGEWWEESRWALAKISMDARIAAYKDNGL
ncbi:hypothetical protein BLNAU_25223 [Blattamonas nauphoetae]|uniref:Uncharacterized protein n=1 Tax=Blattamonas nauphoetae TaxID=2049346 RepID=A0ABQ9WL14_9EUKA|nr:hypothetical protein BLNAU_25223 [Blattamonas nauphoetae]